MNAPTPPTLSTASLLLITLIVFPARAADHPPAATRPTLDTMPSEYLSLYAFDFDAAHVDLSALDTWVQTALPTLHLTADQLKSTQARWTEFLAPCNPWLAQFTKLGGRRLYQSSSFFGFAEHEPNDWWVCALDPSTDPHPLRDWLEKDAQKNTYDHYETVIRDKVIISASHRNLTAFAAKEHPFPWSFPDMPRARASTDAPIRCTVILQGPAFLNTFGAMFDKTVPWGPELAKRIDWISVGLYPPPHPRLRIVIQAMSPAAAREFQNLLADDLTQLSRQPLFNTPQVKNVLPLLRFTRTSDLLTLELDEKQLLSLGTLLGPLMR
jgi:hypothetical protein